MMKKIGNDFYSRQIKNLLYVLVITFFVLITKLINTNATNKIISIIEKNIYYNFSVKEDGKKAKDYIVKAAYNSINSIEDFTKDILKTKSNKEWLPRDNPGYNFFNKFCY